jgi:hypothetical protein
MLRIFRDRRVQRELAMADADALIAQYGGSAYGYARRYAHQARRGKFVDGNRPDGHWDRVRQIIGRKNNRQQVDTSTRYLE